GIVGGSLVKNSLLSEHARYCPSCMQDDEINYGAVYLHRLHQLSFLSACPIHNVKLISHCKDCLEPLVNSDYSQLLVSSTCKFGHQLVAVESKFENKESEAILLNELAYNAPQSQDTKFQFLS